jgi:alanine-synthesizing transaminase
MRLAMIENMPVAEGYCHQKGIFPAREAVVMQQQMRGITGISAEEVFIGNGVSELIDLCLRALLNDGDEVLIPSPDYPLWSAAVTLNGARRSTTRAVPRTTSCRIRRDRGADHAQNPGDRRHQP